jgi:hypothetical protein
MTLRYYANLRPGVRVKSEGCKHTFRYPRHTYIYLLIKGEALEVKWYPESVGYTNMG